MTEREKMTAGLLYQSMDEELVSARKKSRRLMREYNAAAEADSPQREVLLKELLGSVGEECYIEPVFRFDYGFNISIGRRFYANFDCIMLDVCPITIGDYVLLGPRTGLFTASHPLDAALRRADYECALPITIEDDVWLGGNVVVNPGVTIGKGSIIGSGSVVTKNIPAGVVAVGNPCRVLRPLTEEDSRYWKARFQTEGIL